MKKLYTKRVGKQKKQEEPEEEKDVWRVHIFKEVEVEDFDTEEEADMAVDRLSRVENAICKLEKTKSYYSKYR